jgi:hypothetical protein
VRAGTAAGFSIALPKRWRSLDKRTALSPRRLKRFALANPRLQAQALVLAGPNSPIELIAVDTAGRQRFRANMNVIQTRVPKSLTFEQLSKDEATQIKLASIVHDMRQATLKLPAGTALRLTYRVEQTGVVYQYFVRHAGLLYVLTYTVARTAAPRYAKIFDMSARTFQLR